jgi:hypothetical protein
MKSRRQKRGLPTALSSVIVVASVQQTKGGDPMISGIQVEEAVAGFSGVISDRMTAA